MEDRLFLGTGNCITTDKRRCVFPFKYNGSEFSKCLMSYNGEKYWRWCGTIYDVTDSQTSWGECSRACTTTEGKLGFFHGALSSGW